MMFNKCLKRQSGSKVKLTRLFVGGNPLDDDVCTYVWDHRNATRSIEMAIITRTIDSIRINKVTP